MCIRDSLYREKEIELRNEIAKALERGKAVSYTHLDVYKRQGYLGESSIGNAPVRHHGE